VSAVVATKSGGTVELAWEETLGASFYDTLRGRVRDWPVGWNVATEACLFDDASGTTSSDAAVPAPGEGYWYLVRAGNACGHGGYGSQASSGVPTVPRTSTSCP